MVDLKRLSVLVIEANQSMRGQLRGMLENQGLSGIQFSPSAGMAVRRLREQRFDVILCEYNLGDGQDGQHLLEDLRSNEIIPLDTIFIMVTGERNYERVVSAAELIPDDYILKPLTPGALHQRLQRALERRDALLPIYRLIQGGDPIGAIELCAAREQDLPRYRTDLMRLRAELLASHGHAEEAEAVYRAILQERPIPWARLGLAKTLFGRKRFAEAEEILLALVEANRHFLDAYDWLARTREEIGKLEQAREVLANAVALSPHRIGRLRRFGEMSLTVGDLPTAEKTLAEVVRKGKYSDFRAPEDHVRLVRAQLGQGRIAEAESTIRDLERSMENLPATGLCTSLSRALYHASKGERDAAQDTLRSALKASGDLAALSVPMRQELAKACLDHQLEQEGSELVMDILRASTDERTVETTRSMLRERGREDLSDELEQRLHAEVKSLIAAGAHKAQAGDLDGAVQEMMVAVHKMPGNPHVLFNAALALLRHIEHRGWNERLVAQARTLIARTRRFDPNNPRLDALVGFMQQLGRKYGTKVPALGAAPGPSLPPPPR